MSSNRRSSKVATEEDHSNFDREIEEMFKVFDRNGDKTISIEELRMGLKSMGTTFTYKEAMLAAKTIDKDKNGKIDITEFKEYIRQQFKKQDISTQAREAFRVFDRDGNGSIDRKELKYAMKLLGEKLSEMDVSEMITEADTNGDGKISFEEFLTLWNKKMKGQAE
ncbi:hypothetical protein DPMN_182921 [Dreissena polymorpha]|uniref:Sulfhydryl light chain n=1 Tax=Dreissena polymorpha TaxID=45954 RepID=A0A9D4DHG2_DREPO|nr:hypothetical protein DPMN_182921 [Dreissena polymorpha]